MEGSSGVGVGKPSGVEAGEGGGWFGKGGAWFDLFEFLDHGAPRSVARSSPTASLCPLMGSLIKKRRKRMRKKKHRKLLKRTRIQRRNKKK